MFIFHKMPIATCITYSNEREIVLWGELSYEYFRLKKFYRLHVLWRIVYCGSNTCPYQRKETVIYFMHQIFFSVGN